MFTGFATENTPAIQVWDFARTYASTGANGSVSLADDCAPIQLFKSGAVADLDINVYLPSAPVEGKSITIVNAQYASSKQGVSVYCAESFYGTVVRLNKIGPGQKITYVYCSASISSGTTNGSFPTGWVALDLAHKGALNNGSTIVGGNDNSTRNTNCFVGGGANNNATASSSSVVGGGSNTASGTSSGVFGGSNNTASGTFAAIVGGASSTASNTNAVVLGGSSNTANAIGSVAIGGEAGNTRSIQGNLVASASISPVNSFPGVQQTGLLILGTQTTDATTTTIRSNTSAASTTNQVILPNNSAYYVRGSIIATVTGGGNTKSWDFIATIKRGATAASTAIVGAVTLNVQAADAGAATWTVAITADTTNGGLAVTVTGQAATTIRWVAKLESTEVTY